MSMFCTKCGNKLSDNAKFCSACGEKVNQEADNKNVEAANDSTQSSQAFYNESRASFENDYGTKVGDEEKINWKEFLTIENIEKFAPITALAPIIMAVVCTVLGGILFATIGRLGIGYIMCKFLFFVIKALFILMTAGATGALIYIIINRKNPSVVNVWVTPVATFIAAIACLGIAFRWGAVSWIFGIVAVVFGLEFMARIVLEEKPIESAFNPALAFNTYKKYYNDYRAKYPTTKDLERAGIVDPENSKFDGSGAELLGYWILAIIVCTITCGFATPWMICKINKWRLSHTVVNGKRLTFTGSGGSLLGHWILWQMLTMVTCGIYGFFLHVALRKWEMKHTYIEDEPILASGNTSYFDGGSFAYFGYGLLSALFLIITCGLSYPWVMVMLQKWDTKHQVINGRRLAFSGTGLGFLGEFLIIFLLSLITCGLYMPWGVVRMNKYIIRNTDFIS